MTFTLDQLLPKNSTILERNLLKIYPYEELYAFATKLKTARLIEADIPDNAVPWLFLEYGLGELSEFLDITSQQALSEALEWQTVRGTIGSVKQALGWVGITDPVIERDLNNPWYFNVTTEQLLTNLSDVTKLVNAVVVSKSPYTRLGGISNVTDNQMFILDKSPMDNAYFHNPRGIIVAVDNADNPDVNVFFREYLEENASVTSVSLGGDDAEDVYGSRVLLKIIRSGNPTVYRRTRYKKYLTPNVSGDIEVDGVAYDESLTPTAYVYFEFLIRETDVTDDDITNLIVVYDTTIDSGVLASSPGKEYWAAADVTAETTLKDLTTNTIPRAEYIENIIRVVIHVT